MKRILQHTTRTAVCFVLLAASIGGPAGAHPVQEAAPTVVQVKLLGAAGTEVGMASLTQKNDAVVLHVEAKNLPPGVHGIHFHETGKCEAPDFKTAGAHFNPQTKQHGFNNPKGFHVGDLPNISVAADGSVKVDIETRIVTLAPNQPNSLRKTGGTALVIHEKADDYATDPSGNSGNRIVCGVIQ
ncbi:superoxide dismutase family protein [Paenibacillus sp. BC26]|uniref:superoxide dismutase family protein n=1 Tax=Paenibacillus sp. BC26 TaxID=1881032 RepID=UPI0008DF78BF|nr:superoxide dismutase family protein [Paenibacillus sp. BC26]SFS68077.1 superoxide dismutase, Cu-Zn family [Paenibacillus sp. BC26]